MTTLSLTDPVNGTVTDAAVIANNNAALKNLINGNIDGGNINSSALLTISRVTSTGDITARSAAVEQIVIGKKGTSEAYPSVKFGISNSAFLWKPDSGYTSLQVTGGLIVPGAVGTFAKAGAVVDNDVAVPMRIDGTIVLDSTNHRLYVRSGGSWKYAQLA